MKLSAPLVSKRNKMHLWRSLLTGKGRKWWSVKRLWPLLGWEGGGGWAPLVCRPVQDGQLSRYHLAAAGGSISCPLVPLEADVIVLRPAKRNIVWAVSPDKIETMCPLNFCEIESKIQIQLSFFKNFIHYRKYRTIPFICTVPHSINFCKSKRWTLLLRFT